MDQQTPTVQAILLVEDQPLIRMSVVDFLVDQGYRVEEAGTASFAIERIHTLGGQLGALILDLGLPDRPGAMVAREIRVAYPDLPIIVTSGHSVAEMRRHFESPADMAFLTKPYDLNELARSIEALSRGRPRMQQSGN